MSRSSEIPCLKNSGHIQQLPGHPAAPTVKTVRKISTIGEEQLINRVRVILIVREIMSLQIYKRRRKNIHYQSVFSHMCLVTSYWPALF